MFPDEVFQQILRVANVTEPNDNESIESEAATDTTPDFQKWEDDLLWTDDDTDDLIDRLAGDQIKEPQESLSDLWEIDDPLDNTDPETEPVQNSS